MNELLNFVVSILCNFGNVLNELTVVLHDFLWFFVRKVWLNLAFLRDSLCSVVREIFTVRNESENFNTKNKNTVTSIKSVWTFEYVKTVFGNILEDHIVNASVHHCHIFSRHPLLWLTHHTSFSVGVPNPEEGYNKCMQKEKLREFVLFDHFWNSSFEMTCARYTKW